MNSQILCPHDRVEFPAGIPGRYRGPDLTRVLGVLIIAAAILLAPAEAVAQASSEDPLLDNPAADLVAATELLLFEEIEEVVSAARRPQPISFSTALVSVVSNEQIHYSGYPSIPELLLSVPGMDVLSVNRNSVALGVRGLHHQFADRTLLLIDGRDATNPVFGGFDLQGLPISSVDIKRIEVIRGPGGAAWGANAFNGVINIITKSPKDDPGFRVFSSINDLGDDQTGFAYADTRDDWGYRLSGGHEDRESSDTAIPDNDFHSRDFAQRDYFNASLNGKPGAKTELSFGLAGVVNTQGDAEMAGYPLESDIRGLNEQEMVRSFGRMDYDLNAVTHGYLQVTGKHQRDDYHGLYHANLLTSEFDCQVDSRQIEDHELSFGTSARWVEIKTERTQPEDMLSTLRENEYWLGAFAIDAWRPSESLTIEGQFRADWYSPIGTDWSGRLSTLYSVDTQQDHILRLSGAKAFRTPLLGLRELTSSRVLLPSPPYPSDMYGLTLIPTPDLRNEQIYSLEAGYSGRINHAVDVRVNAYYSMYEDLIGGESDETLSGRVVALENIGGAEAAGVEGELTYNSPIGALTAWFALNDFTPEHPTQSLRAYYPAQHKAGLSWRYHLQQYWTVEARNRWSSETGVDEDDLIAGDIGPSFNRVDAVTTLALAQGKAHIQIGINDVADDTRSEVMSIGSFTAHETPGRTIFGRLELRF
ncbi:TonB-dependent receptor plug domain-containing protein [Candidatus Eisenbacteria bacterium]|uniref:TonB-dependent receptor plug domain-containing protein n=1 Tax=Eiseniibacteriota bacterium TaxID=2212470 RepID=A0ABV6YJJ0_UNCEI